MKLVIIAALATVFASPVFAQSIYGRAEADIGVRLKTPVYAADGRPTETRACPPKERPVGRFCVGATITNRAETAGFDVKFEHGCHQGQERVIWKDAMDNGRHVHLMISQHMECNR